VVYRVCVRIQGRWSVYATCTDKAFADTVVKMLAKRHAAEDIKIEEGDFA